jgi:hypothetical protein
MSDPSFIAALVVVLGGLVYTVYWVIVSIRLDRNNPPPEQYENDIREDYRP